MKKYLFIIVALFILCFTTNVYSTCPDGFTSGTFTARTPINNCEYTVYFCYKCVMPAPPVGLIIDHIYKNNPNCEETMSTDDVINYLETYLFEHFFTFEYCEIPPCDEEEYIEIKTTYSKCWYKQTDYNERVTYYNCYSYDCCVNERWCWDEVTQLPVRIAVGIPYWCNQTTDCEDSEPADPEPGYSTGCFYISTPCSQ